MDKNEDNVLYSGGYLITTSDVPDEISLAISISGCPLHCKGCHSAFTWDPKFGSPLTDERLEELIERNKHISCVIFYGGEWKMKRLLELIAIVRKHKNLKVCLFTGLELEDVKRDKKELLDVLDYIKVGPWIEEKGGLGNPTTNQLLIKLI